MVLFTPHSYLPSTGLATLQQGALFILPDYWGSPAVQREWEKCAAADVAERLQGRERALEVGEEVVDDGGGDDVANVFRIPARH